MASDQAFLDALEDFKNASATPSKHRKSKISGPVEVICDSAFDLGLSLDSLKVIVDIITQPNELDQSTVATITNCLYPSTEVTEDVVLRIVGCLGQGERKPPLPTQARLLKWLIMVYHVLENQTALSNLYGVLFNMLDMISLRPLLCHLLSLITRRKHVRPYRIQMLLELARNIGNEPPLAGLIRVYKDYYPDVIIGDAASGRASFFTPPNPEWRARLTAIQEGSTRIRGESTQQLSAFKVVRNGAKRSKISAVPDVHTSRANELSVTLEEVENVNDFVWKIDRLELPNQLISVLRDPLLQKFLMLRSTDTIRIDSWLSGFFEEELQSAGYGQLDSSRLSSMLQSILSYAQYTKALLPSCEAFLRAYLTVWDGVVNRLVILELVAFLPIRPWDELFSTFFQYIEEALLDETDASRIALLRFYTSLYRRWTVRLLVEPLQKNRLEDPSLTLQRLITHIDILCVATIEASGCSTPSVSAVLAFYECVANAIMHTTSSKLFRIHVPADAIVYQLTFNGDAMSLSRLCAILAKYKRAFEIGMTTPGEPQAYPRPYVNHFNGLLMDICNCLWRNRAFNSEDTNALGCLVPKSVLPGLRDAALSHDHNLPTLFSLSYSGALSALSIACFRDLEDHAAEANTVSRVRHAGPVTQRSLVQLANNGGLQISHSDYKLEVLRWLEDRGLDGIGELMHNTMKGLRLAKGAGTPGAPAA